MDVEADLLIALRKIAGVQGGDNFTVRELGVSITVDYVGGSSSRLTLWALYDEVATTDAYRSIARGVALTAIRPMSIGLRPENEWERAAKADGINREHQTGDEAFDKAVYVDSPTMDDVVLHAVLNDVVRAATMDLVLLGFSSVTVDDGDRRVSAVISGFSHLGAPDEAASRIVRAFANLLKGLPAVREGTGRHPRRSGLPAVAAWVGFIAISFFGPESFCAFAECHHCTEHVEHWDEHGQSDGESTTFKSECGGAAPLGIGLVVALVVGAIVCVAARAVARPRMSGHSDSHKRIFYVSAAAFFWAALATLVASAAITYCGH
jgi:hypothetical protein